MSLYNNFDEIKNILDQLKVRTLMRNLSVLVKDYTIFEAIDQIIISTGLVIELALAFAYIFE